jgi:uncharacterized protein
MSIFGEKLLLRVYVPNADRAPHAPTWERIISSAWKKKLAGLTVQHGIFGADHTGIIKPRFWSLAEHVPVIVEIVDTPELIADFVGDVLDRLMVNGIVALKSVAAMMYRKDAEDEIPQPKDAIGYHGCARCATALPARALYCPKCGLCMEPFNLSDRGAVVPLVSLLPMASQMKRLLPILRLKSGAHMKIQENGVLLRVFTNESDKFQHKALYQAVVEKARELGIAGATVLRGTQGFGAQGILHTVAFVGRDTDLPLIIEIIDTEENIRRLLPDLEMMVQEGMITMEPVMMLVYRQHNEACAQRQASADALPPR